MKKNKKKMNESFMDAYMNNYATLGIEDLEAKAHVEVSPDMAGSIESSKEIRNRLKDEFKDQDDLVDSFLKNQERDENPKIKSTPELRSMKLSEMFLKESDLDSTFLLEDEAPNYPIEDMIDAFNDKIDDLEDDQNYFEETYKKKLSNREIIEGLQDISRDFDFARQKWDKLNTGISFDDALEKWNSTAKLADPDFYSKPVYNKLAWDSMVDMFSIKREDQEESEEDTEEESNAESEEESNDEPEEESTSQEDEEENSDIETESLHESFLKEDYSNFIGHPLKDFLKTLDHRVRVNIDYEEPLLSGSSGISGLVHDVNWEAADRIIKDIKLGDDRYYKFKILTESALDDDDKEEEKHRYKVIASDVDDNILFLKDVKGIKSAMKQLDQLPEDRLDALGATQVYITRDDNKEVYIKTLLDDGTWVVDLDEVDMERPVEDRDTIFNHMQADLSAESSQFVGHLRKMNRKGKGYVGFSDEDMGFRDDTWYLTSPSRKSIDWAKEVADFYGYKFTDDGSTEDGIYHARIYCPGISKDPKLIP